MIICERLIKNHQYDWMILHDKYPDDTYDVLRKLEMLIVENIYDLKKDFLSCNLILNAHSSFLISIIAASGNDLTIDKFNAKNEQFKSDITKASYNLRNKLVENYIQKNYELNFFQLLYTTKQRMKNFFSKSPLPVVTQTPVSKTPSEPNK